MFKKIDSDFWLAIALGGGGYAFYLLFAWLVVTFA